MTRSLLAAVCGALLLAGSGAAQEATKGIDVDFDKVPLGTLPSGWSGSQDVRVQPNKALGTADNGPVRVVKANLNVQGDFILRCDHQVKIVGSKLHLMLATAGGKGLTWAITPKLLGHPGGVLNFQNLPKGLKKKIVLLGTKRKNLVIRGAKGTGTISIDNNNVAVFNYPKGTTFTQLQLGFERGKKNGTCEVYSISVSGS